MIVCSGMCVLEHVWYTVRDIYLRGTLGVSNAGHKILFPLTVSTLFILWKCFKTTWITNIHTKGPSIDTIMFFSHNKLHWKPSAVFWGIFISALSVLTVRALFKLTLIVREKTQGSNNQGVTSFKSLTCVVLPPDLLWDTTRQDDGIGFCLKRISKANGERW